MCDKPVATFWGWMPNGVKTNIPVPLDGTAEDFDRILNYQNIFLARGFVLDDPAYGKLDAGEKREQVGYVLKRTKDDGTMVIDLYPASERTFFRFVMCYLDNPDDIAAFEEATGLVVKNLPIYDGDRMERGNTEKSNKYIIKVPQSTHAIIKDNPAYNPTETDVKKKKPARIFIRWVTEVAATPAPQPQPSQTATPPAGKQEPSSQERSYLSALHNELVTIINVEKGDSVQNANDNYRGYTYNAGAVFKDSEGSTTTFPLKLWPEDVNAIKKAGYPFPDAGGDCKIPVVLVVTDGQARINVKALTSAAAGVVEGDYKPNWTLIYSKVKHLYDNSKHMGNSVQALFREGAFANCKDDAAAISIIVQHKNGFAEGKTG